MRLANLKKAPSPLSPHYTSHGTKFDRAKSTIFARPELVCTDKLIRTNLLNLPETPFQCRTMAAFIIGTRFINFSVYILTQKMRFSSFVMQR